MTNTVYLKTKDFSVSEEEFELIHDADLDILITSPKPSESNLDRYYASDDYISHTSSKRSLFEMAYHTVRKIAIKDKMALLNSVKSTGSLLDIGAGTGDFLASAAAKYSVSGVEPNQKARALAESKGLQMQSDTSRFANNSFDIITMWHVLEHVPDIDTQIIELKRLLKPGGHIIIAVPNYKSYDAAHYGKFWAAYDVPRHLWHFSQTSVAKIFSRHNLKVNRTLPMKFDAFYVSLLSERYKNGTGNPIAAFITGFKSNFKAKKSSEYSSLIYIIK